MMTNLMINVVYFYPYDYKQGSTNLARQRQLADYHE